jgi:hypothetical protein
MPAAVTIDPPGRTLAARRANPAAAANPVDKPAPNTAPVPANAALTPATRRGTIDRSVESMPAR